MISSVMPSGTSSPAARSAAVLKDALRRLPDMPSTLTVSLILVAPLAGEDLSNRSRRGAEQEFSGARTADGGDRRPGGRVARRETVVGGGVDMPVLMPRIHQGTVAQETIRQQHGPGPKRCPAIPRQVE